MMTSPTLYNRLGVQDPFDPTASYTTSPFFSPLVLAVIRLTLAFYTLFTLIFVLVWDAVSLDTADSFFSYFTELSYIGLCAYFFASGVQTLVYALSHGRSYPLSERWPRILQFLHVLLFSTITTYPLLVTIVYWAVLYPDDPFKNRFDEWSNVSLHALNTVFSFFEILFTHAGPTPWTHVPFIVFFLGCYLGVAYITKATQGFYSYPFVSCRDASLFTAYSFLNPHKEGAALAGWIIAIAVGGIVIFSTTHGIMLLRERLVTRFGLRDTDAPHSHSQFRSKKLGPEFAGAGAGAGPHPQTVQVREPLEDWEVVESPTSSSPKEKKISNEFALGRKEGIV